MNNFTLSVAEDLARGINSAKDLEATAEKYVSELLKAVEDKDNGLTQNHRIHFLDTYAYASVVIEAQKMRPNRDTFRKMSRLLQSIVETFESEIDEKLNKGQHVNKADYFELNAVRARYQSARELAGE
jgi:hypothetical protein